MTPDVIWTSVRKFEEHFTGRGKNGPKLCSLDMRKRQGLPSEPVRHPRKRLRRWVHRTDTKTGLTKRAELLRQ